MNRLVALTAIALVFAGCADDEDLPENPPYAVPGQQVTQPPAGQVAQPMPTGAPPTFDPALAVPGQPSPLPMPQPQLPPGMQPGQVPPGMQPGQVPPGMQPSAMQPSAMQLQPGAQPTAAPISLATGFTPDPQTAHGVTAGALPASSITQRQDCRGYVPQQPSQVLTLTTPFSNLRVLVSAQVDTVLVIRQPDGTFLCNDDGEPGVTMNPVLQGQFAPGAYTIWVGTYAQNDTGPYVIGFTELSSVTSQSLAAP